ncbi:uncharacterized protein LOC111704718 [Eurytemora carolleeae]|uniref:uncharacterized protein LOC111704718 n=1 Tax=Eurytemora carolleeae TaxID=1294199 RepID=UPI000C756165|nr:uncharacterized protein LOC111704718 [Eurytemora carolleeae]|eukprot:XP_023332808.1 uncharacterized protein LOC111704718 [Eurytemora affinis]
MNGNYEELQCDKERCWCMDPDTGKPLSKVVPETLVKFLPCYDRSVFEEKTTSNQYLRKCEARSVGIQRTAVQLRLRGTAWLVSDPVLCDATGGFDRTYCDSSSGACYCVDKTGQRSAYFFTNTGTVSSSCSCARDYIDGIITNVRCDGYGNYPTLQKSTASNGWEVDYCSDSEDGWRLSGLVPGLANKPGGGTKPCCLNSTAVDHSYQVQSPPEYQGFFQCRASVTECDSDPNNCVKYMKDCSFGEQ